jgi:hypothetical protein
MRISLIRWIFDPLRDAGCIRNNTVVRKDVGSASQGREIS